MKCPGCGKEANYMGTGKQSKTGLYHKVWSCDACNKSFIENPGHKSLNQIANKPIYKKAINLFENFNMKPANKIYMQKISLPSQKNPLVHLGHIAGIIYISDKEGKKGQQYIHETEPPYPHFFATSDGQTFLINGGKMKIKAGWLYY